MWELRWVLLGLGALFILGLYLWGAGILRFPARRDRRPSDSAASTPRAGSRGRVEPSIALGERPEPQLGELEAPDPLEPELPAPESVQPEQASRPPLPEKIVALRFIPRQRELSCAHVVSALRAAGLRHGKYGIFHRLSEETGGEPLFSVASLTEPGSFDLSRLEETTLPGMSFFLLVPGPGDPVERFDDMVETARSLAHDLDAELFDDGGSSWSIQRERYIREELIQYRHELTDVATPQPSEQEFDGFR